LAQRNRTLGWRGAFTAGGALLALVGCAPSEVARRSICAQALAVLEPGAEMAAEPESGPAGTNSILMRYRLAGREFALECTFTPRGLERDGLDLTGVRTGREGALSPIALYFLKAYGLGRASDTPTAFGPWTFLFQQLVNALAPAAIYALLATGYALIYGITGRINLAFGEFATVGAFGALSGILLAAGLGVALPGTALVGLTLAALTGAALGAVLYGLIFVRLLQRSSQALLIATVGLAIAFSEALRLLAGSRQSWLQPFFSQPLTIGGEARSQIVVSLGQILLAGLALATIGAVTLVLRRTPFGRAFRACAEDPGAAALVGVDVDQTVAVTCVLGSALAAVAGFAIAGHYGIVGFAMGTLWGFKALTAAVVGGIGSVPGAALGGVLIGLLETLWAGYLPGTYREVAVFALLALMLAVRPNGLFGGPAAVDNPGIWRARPPG
jgi:branched-chain amino acid transport system permease protein